MRPKDSKSKHPQAPNQMHHHLSISQEEAAPLVHLPSTAQENLMSHPMNAAEDLNLLELFLEAEC